LAIPLAESNDSIIAHPIEYYERGDALDGSKSSHVNSYSPLLAKERELSLVRQGGQKVALAAKNMGG
jgi:hypothetical protein